MEQLARVLARLEKTIPSTPAEDRQVFRRGRAVLTTCAHETAGGDRGTRQHFCLRKQASPVLRQTQFDRTDSYRQPSTRIFLSIYRLHRLSVEAWANKTAGVR